MVFRMKGKRGYYGKLPLRHGWKNIYLQTHDLATARAMQRMLDELRHQRRWEVLDGVADRRLAVGGVYDAYRLNALDALLALQADLDLEPKVPDWQRAIRATMRADSAKQYLAQLRTLIPEGRPFLRSQATPERLATWLYALPVKSPTQRRYFASAQSFFGYLVRVKLLDASPLRDLARPADGKARVRWLSTADAERVVRANDMVYQAYSALLHGTGIEVSVACGLRLRDVNASAREVFAPGTKTHARERTVRVAEWAWEYFAPVLRWKAPDALLFPGMKRGAAGYQHRRVCRILHIEGYQLRDARHTWAVRAARAGTPPEIIARQLGHVDATMVLRVYGRFFPSAHDREKWERIATLQDQADQEAR